MPGPTAGGDAAPVARRDSDQERRWWMLAHPSGNLGGLAHRREHRRGGGRRRLTARRWPGVAPFAAVYLLYDASRWIFAGRLPVAREHAHQIVNLERSPHLAGEGIGAARAGLGRGELAVERDRRRCRATRSIGHGADPLVGALVTLSLLVTGNHYLFEVDAGLLVTAVGFSAGGLTRRRSQQRPGVRSVRRLIPATRS